MSVLLGSGQFKYGYYRFGYYVGSGHFGSDFIRITDQSDLDNLYSDTVYLRVCSDIGAFGFDQNRIWIMYFFVFNRSESVSDVEFIGRTISVGSAFARSTYGV